MKKRLLITAGVLCLVFCFCLPVMAATGGQIMATFSGSKIMLDGIQVSTKNAEPVTINGTTYLPVRTVAEALDLNVDWDANSNTILINSVAPQNLQQDNINSEYSEKPQQQVGYIIYEENGIKITYNGITKDDFWPEGYNVNLKIENTTDKRYEVQVRDFSVNGIMANEFFSCTVAGGKIAFDDITFYNLSEQGITEPIKSVEFYFHIYNADDWTERFGSGIIHIGA